MNISNIVDRNRQLGEGGEDVCIRALGVYEIVSVHTFMYTLVYTRDLMELRDH